MNRLRRWWCALRRPPCSARGHRLSHFTYEMDKVLYIVYRWTWCGCRKRVRVDDQVPQAGFKREPKMRERAAGR